MIEKFTNEELKILLEELSANGIIKTTTNKGILLKEEAEKLGYKRLFISSDLNINFYNIADILTDNFLEKPERSGKIRRYKNNVVSAEKEEEYRSILSVLLQVLRPYCGIQKFREV